MGYKYKSFAKKHNKKIMAAFLAIVLFIAVFIVPSMASENLDTNLGFSGIGEDTSRTSIMPTAIGDIKITEVGSIATGDLKLVLSGLPDAVVKVTMTTPAGKTETKNAAPTDGTKKPLPLGASGKTTGETEVVAEKTTSVDIITPTENALEELVDNGLAQEALLPRISDTEVSNTSKEDTAGIATLGASDSAETDKISLFSSGVDFTAPTYGMYVFELYGNDGTNDVLIDRVSYMVKLVMNDEALTVVITGTGPTFYLQDQQNVYVRYVPQLIGNKEILTIVVPPMYTIDREPDSAPGYVVSPIGTMALPEELYDDAASDILKTFPANTNVQYFTITYDGSIDQGMGFSFDTRYVNNYANNGIMGKIMLAYGTDAEKVPMRIGGFAKSADGTILVDKEAINGTALIKGAKKILFPDQNKNVGLYPSYPGDSITEGLSREPIRIETWHYPMTDIRVYYAYDPTVLTPKAAFPGHQETIDGQVYWVTTWTESQMGAANNIGSGQRFYFNYGGNFAFPPNTSLKEDDIINFGPTMVDYTYLGVEYKHVNAGNTVPFKMSKYADMNSFSFLFRGTSGNWGTGTLDRELEQGTFGTKFRFSFNNSVGYSNNPTYVYEEAKVIFDFPYGVYPTSIALPNVRKSTIQSIEYYLADNPDVPVYEHPAAINANHTFGISGDDRITKLIINYDNIHNATNASYEIAARIGTLKTDGTLMERVENVSMKASIKTKDDMKTMGYTSASPAYKPFTYTTTQNFQLIRYEKEDSLRFGSVNTNRSDMSLYNEVESRNHPKIGAGFKKFTLLMKDYENVVIEVTPLLGDAKLLSFVKGFYFSSLTPGIHVEKNEVYYKSNLKPNWTLAETITGTSHIFDLDQAAGEYVTGVKAELGTLYGDALVANVGTASSSVDANGYSHINNNQQHMFNPIMFESKRAFFEGSAEEVPLPIANIGTNMEYQVYTSSEAQYINKLGTPHPTLNSDKAKGGSVISSYVTQGFGFGDARVRVPVVSQFQGDTFDINLYVQGGTIGRPPVGGLDYYAKIYLEVHKDFSIVEIPGCTLVEVKTATDTGNKVYIFETYMGNNANNFHKNVKMLVHPDAAAPVSGVQPFVRGGISEDAFKASYMSNNDYYKVHPYTIYNPTGHALYPEWGIQSDLFWRMTFKYEQRVNTQVNSLTSVKLFPEVDGKPQADQGIFRDYEKTTLALRGAMGNNSGGEIPHYEAKFAIPKKDRNTRIPDPDNPGVPFQRVNEYDMYVTGPVQINPLLLNLDVKYLRKDGSVVDINDPTPDWENVYDVVVRFDKLADRHNEMVVIPLGTDFEKTGNDFTIYKAYLGAEARSAPTPGAWGQYALSHALEYDFDHYYVNVKVGQDVQELGRYQTALTDTSLVKIQSYYDDNGVEKELEVLNVGGELQFNRDATRMTATVLKPDLFYITPGNYIPDENNDSDFIVTSAAGTPKVAAAVNITWEDLEKRTANKYDLALYALPYVTVPDSLNIPAHTTVNVNPTIRRVFDNVIIPNPLSGLYLREVSNNTTPTVANIVANPNTKQMNITGIKAGSTTYMFTVENNFGERFEVAQPIKVTVVPNYAPNSRVYKTFDTATESKNLGSPVKDTFSFEAWAGNVDNQTNMHTVAGVTEVTYKAITKLERGETNFIREITQEGYVSMGFTVTNNGTPVAVTHVKDGIYSFDLPANATNVYVTAINKNDVVAMTVKKLLKAGSHMETPTDTFNITVTDKGSTAVVVNKNFAPTDTVTAADLQYGRTYVVKENLPAGTNYEIDSAKIKLSSAPAGTDLAGANNTYEITVVKGQKNAEITITNKYAEGAGLVLRKYMPDLTNANLPKERMEFTLTSDNNFEAFGLVDSNVLGYPATVKWYKTNAYNLAEEYANLNVLPIGNYTLTEVGTNTNFEFEKYIANGANVTNKVHTFAVTKTSPVHNIGAYNKIKTIGSITLNKSLVSADFLNETLEFKLIYRATGQVYSGKTTVTGDNIVFNNWKISPANTNHQGGLPLGEYYLTEEDNQYFDFDLFTADPRIATINGGKTAVFTLTGDGTNNAITIAASNKLKQGKLTLNKRVTTNLGSHASREFFFELYKYDKTTRTGTVIDLNGAAAGNATSITITQADLISGKALVLPGTFDYGSYYVVEKDDTDFALQAGASSVLAETDINVSAKVFNIVHPTNTEVTAVNRLKSAPQALGVYMVAKDADQVGANTFAFELYSKDYANVETLIYNGQVLSTASGIGSTTGANVVWTPAGGGTPVIGIAGLPYGNYVVKETATGDDFLPLDVSASGFGSKVSSTIYEFPVGSATGGLADFFVRFENKLRNDGTILVNKTFTDSFNPFPTTNFVFKLKNTLSGKIYTGETTGATPVSSWKDASGVVIPTSEVPYGRYELTENVDVNYDLVEFKAISGLATIPPGKTTASITINSTNKRAEVSAENKVKQDGAIDLYKLFENDYNHDATSAFTVEIQGPFDGTSIGTAPKQTVTLQSSSQWKSVISNLKYGYYRVTEILDPASDYYLVSINSTSSPTGTPVAVDVEIGAKAGQSKTQKIDITNKVASDGKITITKAMDGINTLPDQLFDFTVTDGLGKSQTVQIKAGESKTLTDLLLGEYSIKESLVPDFDHMDFTLNDGSKVAATQVSIVLSGGTRNHNITSTSGVKADGTFTIRADFANVEEKPDLAEEFTFQILQSINGGAWEAPKQRSSEYVTLKIGESYTMTNLLRGAEYKAVSVQLPTSPFEVREIVINSGEKHTVIEDKEAIFVPVEGELLSDITFMLDIKRTELIIDKFIYYRYTANGVGFYLPDGSIVYGEAWPDMKVSGAEFKLSRYDSKGELHTTANWKKLTDDYGAIVYGGLSVGKYQIKETKAPKGYGILHYSFDFEVHNDPLTGKLFITTDELPEGVTMSKENVLGIPNLLLHQTSRDNTDGKLDGDSPLGEKPEEPVGDYLQSIESFGLLPAAGGFPIAIVALVGILAVAIGIFVKKKDKKDKQ